MQDPSVPTHEDLEEHYDSPLERLQLLGGDDAAIAAFLDEIDVRGPRDRSSGGASAIAAALRAISRAGSRSRRSRSRSASGSCCRCS